MRQLKIQLEERTNPEKIKSRGNTKKLSVITNLRNNLKYAFLMVKDTVLVRDIQSNRTNGTHI
jgi:hypothetical protein